MEISYFLTSLNQRRVPKCVSTTPTTCHFLALKGLNCVKTLSLKNDYSRARVNRDRVKDSGYDHGQKGCRLLKIHLPTPTF